MRMCFAALAALFCLLIKIQAGFAAPPGSHWNEDYFGNPELITQDGKRVHFYDDLIKDKIVFIDFFYTHCIDICPLTTARTARLADELKDRLGKDIWILSISLDPVRDTPEMVKMFAEGYQVRPGWIFLTSDDPLGLKKLRFRLGEKSRKLSEHFAYALIGNEKTGEWRQSSVMTQTNLLADEILRMDPVYRNTPPKQSAEVASTLQNRYYKMGDLNPGEPLFRRACASCHTVGKGDLIGPDLKDAHVNRPNEWLTNFIMHPDVMIAKKDPIAMELMAKYKNVHMPFLGINEADAKDLIGYIKFASENVDKAKNAAEARAGTPAYDAAPPKAAAQRAPDAAESKKRAD
jgi:cytochrome oxidase Cu insertion factor (SCO1/SenC/PrrC family)/mono/diheme cytochrome c family protein